MTEHHHVAKPRRAFARARFRAVIEPIGRAAGVEIPAELLEGLGSGKRPKVLITINNHTWRSAVIPHDGRSVVGIGATNRKASNVSIGDHVEVEVQLDEEPRPLVLPPDLLAAIECSPRTRRAFDRLPYGRKRGILVEIERARAQDTRNRRIAEAVKELAQQEEGPS